MLLFVKVFVSESYQFELGKIVILFVLELIEFNIFIGSFLFIIFKSFGGRKCVFFFCGFFVYEIRDRFSARCQQVVVIRGG